jgi:hypothetical protein
MPHSPTHEAIHDKTTARHRRIDDSTGSPFRLAWTTITHLKDHLKSSGATKVALAASVLSCLALGAMANAPSSTSTDSNRLVASNVVDRAFAQRASRAADREAPASSTQDNPVADALKSPAQKAQEAAAKQAAEAKKAAEAAAAAATKAAAKQPAPVAGLDQTQMNNAKAIVDAGKALGLPKQAYVAAVMCSLQESKLYNLASYALPESWSYSNQGGGSDHDSVGLFQQRPSSGWGTIRQIMQPSYAATQFYKGLMNVAGWQSMALTYAIQAVQVSAFPDAYAQHQDRAQAIVDALAP